jgi:hypothetical protein
MKFVFGDIVVVDEDQIGIVVKSWGIDNHGNGPKQEVYVRSYNSIKEYPNSEIERYQVRHKYLDDNEVEYQHSAEIEP